MKEILKEFKLISFCRDSERDAKDSIVYELQEISMTDEKYTDIDGDDCKELLQVGDFEIFDTKMQNTYGFCRRR